MTISGEVSIEGIVLKNKAYKENDMLVWIYAKDYGKIALIARGAKKLKSKNAPACQTITLGDYTFIPRIGLSTLIKASSCDYFRHIKEDIELESYASYFIEFIYKFTKDNDPDELSYKNLFLALKYLDAGYAPKLVYLLFNAYIMEITGSALEVEQCTVCGRHDHIAGISIHGGGFVCQECIGIYDLKLEVDVLKGFRYINLCKLENIDRLHLDEAVIIKLIEIMEAYIDEFTGMTFQSRKFIRQFNGL